MSKYQFSIGVMVLAILIPISAYATYDDVTLVTDTNLYVGGVDVGVSGSNAVLESITINESSFSVTLLPGSSITITSTGHRQITADNDDYVTVNGCDSLTLGGVASSVTVVVTPSTDLCSGGGGSNNNGGGGGGSSKPKTSPKPILSPILSTVPSAPLSSGGLFSIDLSRGSANDDVSRLQQFLSQDKSIYPEGLVTGYFGPATESAVKRFQAKYGIPQVGMVGPMTRAQINLLSSPSATPPTPQTSVVPGNPSLGGATFSQNLQKGSSNEDVGRLQKLLNTDVDTRIAMAGPGSPGNETTLFGDLTEKAVGSFQIKYNIAKPGDEGFGTVGPMTRAKLLEVFGK